MINLDSTLKKLQAITAVAPSTPLTFYISFVEIDQATFATTALSAVDGTFNSSATDILAAPVSGRTRQIRSIAIYNPSNGTHTVSIIVNNNGTQRIIKKLEVSTLGSLFYENGEWSEGITAVIGTNIITLSATSDPAAPGAGTLYAYAKTIANRAFVKQKGPSGLDTALQPLFARNKIGYWCPPGNATTAPGILGFTAYTAVGTATSRVIATTNMFTRMRRLGYVGAAGAGSLASLRVAAAQITLGDGAGLGGFFKLIRFGISDAAFVSGARMFVGISSNTGAATNVEPASLTNSIGVGHGAANSNLFIYHGGSIAQPPIDLGANFPCDTANVDVYELALFASAEIANTVYYEVTRLNTGHIASGTLTGSAGTVMPASSTLLTYTQAWRSNNTTALAVALDIMSDYIETDQ